MNHDIKAKSLLIRAFILLGMEFSRQCNSYRLGDQTDAEVLESDCHEEIDHAAIAELKAMRHLLDDIEEHMPEAADIAEIYTLWESGQMPFEDFLAAARVKGWAIVLAETDMAQLAPLNG